MQPSQQTFACPGINNFIWRHPSPPGGEYAELHQLQLDGTMGVRRDYQFCPHLPGHARIHIPEVQAVPAGLAAKDFLDFLATGLPLAAGLEEKVPSRGIRRI